MACSNKVTRGHCIEALDLCATCNQVLFVGGWDRALDFEAEALRIFYTFNRHEDKRLFAFLTELEGLFQSFPFREFAGMSQSGMNIRGQVPV